MQYFNPHHEHLYDYGSLCSYGVDVPETGTELKTSDKGRFKLHAKDRSSKILLFAYQNTEFYKISTKRFFETKNIKVSSNLLISTLRNQDMYIRISREEALFLLGLNTPIEKTTDKISCII